MRLFEHVLRERMRRRAYYGRRHRSRWFAPRGYYAPRRRVQVRGCGCCLPIPLALTTACTLGLRHAVRRRRRRSTDPPR